MAGSVLAPARRADDWIEVAVPAGADPDTYIPEQYVGNPIPPNRYCRGWNSRREKYCRAIAGSGTDHSGQGRCEFHGGNSPIATGIYSTIKHERVKELFDRFAADPDILNLESEVAMCRALFQDFVERYADMTEALLAWHRSWELERLELPEEQIIAFERVVTEFEIAATEERIEATDRQKEEISEARKFLNFLRGQTSPANAQRPRKILDIADAHRILDTTSKIVERIEKIRAENAISRSDFVRLTSLMGGIVQKHVSELAPKVISEDQAKALCKKIGNDWGLLATR